MGGGGGEERGDCARRRRSRLGGIRSILSEYDGSTLHTRVAASGARGVGRREKGEENAATRGG